MASIRALNTAALVSQQGMVRVCDKLGLTLSMSLGSAGCGQEDVTRITLYAATLEVMYSLAQ